MTVAVLLRVGLTSGVSHGPGSARQSRRKPEASGAVMAGAVLAGAVLAGAVLAGAVSAGAPLEMPSSTRYLASSTSRLPG